MSKMPLIKIRRITENGNCTEIIEMSLSYRTVSQSMNKVWKGMVVGGETMLKGTINALYYVVKEPINVSSSEQL